MEILNEGIMRALRFLAVACNLYKFRSMKYVVLIVILRVFCSVGGMQSGLPCVWMDARDVLVVTPSGKQQVDPDYEPQRRSWTSGTHGLHRTRSL